MRSRRISKPALCSIRGGEGRDGLVAPEPESFQVRNPIPQKVCRVLDLLHIKSYVGSQKSTRWCGAEAWRGGCQLRCRLRLLTGVQNYEVCPKISLVLLRNEALI
ncbi:hypothetical protein AVEN_214048-1 [Araneus ventricosus]|uniref:Uncharacterized protein n=1 Tax=Araneus ventricosus TaxID=182803 RepID=A0A4Y2HJL4_ARAVE|nr:hypothetical protein AVEN_227301-1 [Araneus ventricosus]GBM65495.1 hypothetical protein AVEN_106652-1 [Araneus ventricosus]GBM65540.1 hypothetical protein AVEN_183391-1 [Araneus ventricosus]GBM65546.1 hypothetical protein AVEN_214048-1 [Araneus ventricosus]